MTAAITGSIHTPAMSPYLPITPDEIAEEAIKAREAGASIVHLHARNPKTGAPSSDPELIRKAIIKIKKESDVIICITTGGGLGMTAEERIQTIPLLKPEMASLNMGSLNFGLYPLTRKIKTYKYPWEKPYLEMTKDFVYKNTFADQEHFCKTMYEYGTKPELECFDVSHLYNSAQLIRDGVLKLPIHIQFAMGILGGIGTEVEDLLHMKHTSDRLFGKDYTWSVLAAGRHEFPLCAVGAIIGGHVRVGLEDNLRIGKGILAKSNAELVKKMVRLIYELTERELMTPDETRKTLGLKGRNKVNF